MGVNSSYTWLVVLDFNFDHLSNSLVEEILYTLCERKQNNKAMTDDNGYEIQV